MKKLKPGKPALVDQHTLTQLPFFTQNKEEEYYQSDSDVCTSSAVGVEGRTFFSHENKKRNNSNSFTSPPSRKRNQSQVEANGGDGFCTKTSVNGTPIKIISPPVRENEYTGHGYIHTGQSEVHMTCTSLDMSTSVLMSGYTKHLQCPEYIRNRNAQVNGRITRWRTGTLKLLEQVEQSGLYLVEDYENQYKFADKIIGKLQECLNEVKVFPIDILNKEALLQYVRGVDDEEVADFTYKIANCQTFCLITISESNFRSFQVITRFNGDNSTKTAYGQYK
jgi:hypothetical protein